MLICIVGMDGSGKTTLAHNMRQALTARGEPFTYVYGRFQPLLARPVMAMLRPFLLRGQRGNAGYADYARRRRRLFANPVLYAGYQCLLNADYLLQVGWRIALPRSRGQSMVCDRYYIDTVAADIAIDTREPRRTLRWMLPLYRRLLPRPDLIVLTDVPAEIALARKHDIPDPGYARRLRELYLEAATLEGITVLDGREPPDKLVAQVMKALDVTIATNAHNQLENVRV